MGRRIKANDPPAAPALVPPPLRCALDALYAEGWELWRHFDRSVRQEGFHPFMPADYEVVERALLPYAGSGIRFLEWGSAMGVITIMADLLGLDAYGIELDGDLVGTARGLAGRFGSKARFAHGSFLPTGYRWRSPDGDRRQGTIGDGPSGYLEFRRPLEDFDLIFAFPWTGEEPMMHDLIRKFGRSGAGFMVNSPDGVRLFHDGIPSA